MLTELSQFHLYSCTCSQIPVKNHILEGYARADLAWSPWPLWSLYVKSLLNYCGIIVNSIEAYDNKVVTVEMPGVLEAYNLMDSIQEEGYCPFMQVYSDGKLLSDNIGPVA